MPYEGMFVVHNKEAKKDHDYLEEYIRGVLDKVGATVVRLAKWDERQLAYEIEGQRDGIFYLCHFESEGSRIADLRREARLSEVILRLLVLKLDEIPSEDEVRRRSGRAVKEEETKEEGAKEEGAKEEEGKAEGEGTPSETTSEKPATAEAAADGKDASAKPASETESAEASAPEKSAPEASAPETSAPEASAPEKSAPEASAPEA